MMDSLVLKIDGIIWWLVLVLAIIAILLTSSTQSNRKRNVISKNMIELKNKPSDAPQPSQMNDLGKNDGKPNYYMDNADLNISDNSDISEYWISKKAFVAHEIEVMGKITLIGNTAVKIAQIDSNEALRQLRKPI